MNGAARVCEEGSDEEKELRQLHLSNNVDYRQFIVGKNVAVIAVEIERARICDVHDHVSYWNYEDGISDVK